MAYRRRQGLGRQSTFQEETYHPSPLEPDALNVSNASTVSSSSSLAAQAIKASAVHRESSLSSAYDPNQSKVSNAYQEAAGRGASKSGFWGIFAQKAKSMLEEDGPMHQFESSARSRWEMADTSRDGQELQQSAENNRRMDHPTIRKGLDKITSSLNQIGDTFEKAFEGGRTIVGNKTADIIQETRKLQIRRKGNYSEAQNNDSGVTSSWNPSPVQATALHSQTSPETQLKASRDVAMATAAKAKLLLRELKTVKADLAFAKQRCAQLEEENKVLREGREKGSNPADDDLIRLQLETLLAEKARLAHENEIYARENRFLREIVEYHQLTMQDVVYIDEGIEEVAEVYPTPSVFTVLPSSPPSPKSPPSPEKPSSESPHTTEEMTSALEQPQEKDEVSASKIAANSIASAAEVVEKNDVKSLPTSSA